jgi:bifunctional NMN adenylyltransferase/nudix hydrolase
MNKEFDLLVFVGRFQPLHLEHKRIIDIALQKSRNVLVLVGSAGKARTIRNPFTFDERKQMILDSFSGAIEQGPIGPAKYVSDRLTIKPLYDKTYNDAAWVAQVQSVVKETILETVNDGFAANGIADAKVGLIGASKDNATQSYLEAFPQYERVDVTIKEDFHATDIRDLIFSKKNISGVPKNVENFLSDFIGTSDFTRLTDEYQFIQAYKKQWEASPYPPTFVTTDALVVCSGHILLITRKASPGKGLLALPGGFLNQNETIIDGVLRELREETKIKVPLPVLKGSITKQKVFDDPNRSARGRTITHCALIQLPNGDLPKAKGGDDASYAKWYKISDLREDMLFEDHFAIVEAMIGLS